MHLHLYFMCLYLLRYSWGGCWLRDFSWEITLTAPPSSHRNRRALATKLTVFTQTHDGFHHAAVVTPELAPGSSGLTLTTACCFLEEP